MLAVPRERLARVHASSGTTGQPTVVGYTAGDIQHWSQLVARSMRAAGVRRGNLVHVAYGYGLFTGGLGAHYGAELLGCTVIPMSGGQTEKQVRLIVDLAPDAIMVTPSYALAIADEFARQGLDARATSLRVGIHGAEPWTESMRREIEDRFDMDAVDIYGLSEVMGPGVASECVETKDGLHVWEDHFYPEIIDPATGDGPARRHDGRAGVHDADEGGAAARALPDARPHDAAAGHRAHDAPHGADRWSLGRHADRPRRECLSDANRGDPARQTCGSARTTCSSCGATDRLDELTVVSEVKPGAARRRRRPCRGGGGGGSTNQGSGRRDRDVRLVDPGSIERSLGKAKRVVDLRR